MVIYFQILFWSFSSWITRLFFVIFIISDCFWSGYRKRTVDKNWRKIQKRNQKYPGTTFCVLQVFLKYSCWVPSKAKIVTAFFSHECGWCKQNFLTSNVFIYCCSLKLCGPFCPRDFRFVIQYCCLHPHKTVSVSSDCSKNVRLPRIPFCFWKPQMMR